MVFNENDLKSKKIEDYIKNLIKDGAFKEGDRLFSERKLANILNVSNSSVHNAMQKFIDRGVLEKIHGKGTFVKKAYTNKVRTDKIAVLHRHDRDGLFTSSFYSAILGGIETQAQISKKTIMIRCFMRDLNEDPNQAIYDLLDDVDGFIILDLEPYLYTRIETTLRAVQKPIVMLNYEQSIEGIDSIVTNSRENTEKIIRFLINAGHTRIACIYTKNKNDTEIHPNYRHRVEAYKEALLNNGITMDKRLIRQLNSFKDHLLFRELMDIDNPPTAIFCAGSYMAFNYFIPQAKLMNIRIPEDVSIVGYDDVSECEVILPRLTTLDVSLSEMGRLGMKGVVDKIRERELGESSNYQLVLPGKIIERDSHTCITPSR